MNEIFELKKTLKNQDRVEYELYRLSEQISTTEAQQQVLQHVQDLIPHDYIWQKEPLHLIPTNESKLLFKGSTRFGENVDDEWFIVHVLMNLTQRLPWLAARIWDNDGQFLMIEAADHLPDWCNKSGDQETLLTNRVFIYGGAIHVIPPPTTPGHIKYLPPSLYTEPLDTVDQGLDLVHNTMVDTRAPEPIQQCIRYRMESSMKHYRHRTLCYLPKRVIALLQMNPQLISHAIRAFVNRDNHTMKYTTTMKQFANDEYVYTIVTMSRCQYAQLLSQPFSPPKVLSRIYNTHDKAMDIGLKILVGFEILYQKSKEKDNEQWQSYVERLNNMGYFKGERQGSALYKELEQQARQEYGKTNKTTRLDQSIDDTLSRLNDTTLDKIQSTTEKGDDDKWLDEAAPLTDYFETKQSQMGHPEDRANQMIGGMKQFIQGESSYEGIELEEMMKRSFGGLEMGDMFDEDYDDEEMQSIMRDMDAELRGKRQRTKEEEQEDVQMEQYGEEYVMLKNLLESVKAQGGRAGPTSNLMQQMGIDMPMEDDEDDE
jgi:hypothetical protein